jgi:hypothetical protein
LPNLFQFYRYTEGLEFDLAVDSLKNNRFDWHVLFLSEYARYVNPDEVVDQCLMHTQEDFSLVTIEVATPIMIQYSREVSLTLADKIGVFGELLVIMNS